MNVIEFVPKFTDLADDIDNLLRFLKLSGMENWLFMKVSARIIAFSTVKNFRILRRA